MRSHLRHQKLDVTHYDVSTTMRRADQPQDFVAVRDKMSALWQLQRIDLWPVLTNTKINAIGRMQTESS